MTEPYFRFARKLLESDLWLSEKFTRGQAWIDLIGLANHAVGYIRIRGVKLEVYRGYIGWSEERLAVRWKWSRGKVRRFLKELEISEKIEQQKNNVTTLIKIINYDVYQGDGTTNGQQTVQQTDSKRYNKRTANGTLTINEKNEKNNKPPLPPLPEWLPEKSWSEFIAFRKEIKSPMGEIAITRAIAKLSELRDSGEDIEAVINQSIVCGYKGLFPVKNQKNKQPERKVGELVL